MRHDSLLYGRPLLSLCCGLGEGHVAPVYTKVVARVGFGFKTNGFDTFYLKDLSVLLAASWVSLVAFWVPLGVSWEHPGNILGASWEPLGNLLGASWVPPVCLIGSSWVRLSPRCPP